MKNPIKSEKIRRTCGQPKTVDFVKIYRKTAKTSQNSLFSAVFLVEVAGLELAASSTRNWRATNCATPRNYTAKLYSVEIQ